MSISDASLMACAELLLSKSNMLASVVPRLSAKLALSVVPMKYPAARLARLVASLIVLDDTTSTANAVPL